LLLREITGLLTHVLVCLSDVPFPSDGAFIPDSTDGDGGDDASGASRGEDSAGRKRSSKFRGVTKCVRIQHPLRISSSI
jgi:hypothetical protein